MEWPESITKTITLSHAGTITAARIESMGMNRHTRVILGEKVVYFRKNGESQHEDMASFSKGWNATGTWYALHQSEQTDV